MELTPKGQIIKGYKATDENMCCNKFQFELGVWYEHDGDIKLCESGFHFCTYPSGPWAYYTNGRLFKCEAELVHLSSGPGTSLKHVAKRIRLTEELFIDEKKNIGKVNVGNWNTGNGNVGDENAGDLNTGDFNVGKGNAGNRNTGNRNTGNRNTGNWNTGNGNTGEWNIGNRNTGDWNVGNWNTGQGNCGNFHSGDLNIGDASYYIFNEKADREKVDKDLIWHLTTLLSRDEEIDPTPFLSLPNATPERIKKLHEVHKAARKNMSQSK